MEPFLNAAVRLRLSWLLFRDPRQFFRDKMLRIPKLPRSPVWNPRQRAPAWRPPIGCKDGLPNYQHAQLSVWVPCKQFFRYGRPP